MAYIVLPIARPSFSDSEIANLCIIKLIKLFRQPELNIFLYFHRLIIK